MAKKTKRGGHVDDPSDLPDPVDVYVGSRIRLRRNKKNITQSELGEILGITFQQIQKYERGANRVSASRLFHLCQILDVEINFFFEGFTGKVPYKITSVPKKKQEDFAWLEDKSGDLMTQKETIDLIHIYYQVQDSGVRKQFQKVLKALVVSQG